MRRNNLIKKSKYLKKVLFSCSNVFWVFWGFVVLVFFLNKRYIHRVIFKEGATSKFVDGTVKLMYEPTFSPENSYRCIHT